MSVDAPTERDILLLAKQELKPLLAVVVGAFLTLPTLVFVNGLKPTYICLFGELSEDNGWKHHFFITAGVSLQGFLCWLVFRGIFGEDDGFDVLVNSGVMGLCFGYAFALDRMRTPLHFRTYIFTVLFFAMCISNTCVYIYTRFAFPILSKNIGRK